MRGVRAADQVLDLDLDLEGEAGLKAAVDQEAELQREMKDLDQPQCAPTEKTSK